MIVTFDIETAANDRAGAYWATKRFEAPSNYKDPEKIRVAIDEKRFEASQKSGLYPWTGRVTCITTYDGIKWGKFYCEDETKILEAFGEHISLHPGVHLVGKNSKTFDNPFLVGRYIAHNLGVPNPLRTVERPRDIDECFGFSSQCIRGTLSDYAFMMNIEGKLAHGSQAQAMFDETAFNPEKWDELVNYCQQDVAITHEFLTRYMKPFEWRTACEPVNTFESVF